MIIDLHFHTELYSACSRMTLAEGLKRAGEIGLDGVCITEHDVFHERGNIDLLAREFGVKVFVGTEIYSSNGDILCFGLDRIPEEQIPASELVGRVSAMGGATIAAHPFRNNFRGIGELITALPDLTAVEAFNGNTSMEDNLRALDHARERGIPVTGSSDAHRADRVGCFATEFKDPVNSLQDLIVNLRQGEYTPVVYDGDTGTFQNLI